MQGRAFTYDADGKQTTFNGGWTSGSGATYYYDADGRRVKKVVGGNPVLTTIFVYNLSGLLVAEYSNAQQQSEGTSYLTCDSLRTPRIITTATGAVRSRHDYFPFGEELAAYSGRTSAQGYGADDGLAQKFTQNERDSESGIDFAQARYRDFNVGRFNSPDPLIFQFVMVVDPQRFNLYVYARNNPLRWLDPDGEKVKVAQGSSMEDLYQMVGGEETFNQYFQVVNGQVTLRDGVRLSRANDGVKFLADLIASPDTFLVYTGADASAVARLFDGTTNDKGELNSKGKKIRDEFKNRGSKVATRGRPGSDAQPAGEVFAVVAINPAALNLTQTGIGGFEYPGGWIEAGEQFSGLGQKVQSVSLLIHELAENLDFSQNGTHPQYAASVKWKSPKKDGGFSERWNSYVRGDYHYRARIITPSGERQRLGIA